MLAARLCPAPAFRCAGADEITFHVRQPAKHGDLRWRGSSNQRLVPLTERYRDVHAEPDIGQGLEFTLGIDQTLSWAGVPSVPGFRERVTAGLASKGYGLRVERENM